MNARTHSRSILLIVAMIAFTSAATRLRADTGTCGGASVTLPFTDVMNSQFFCQIAEAYFSGLANGTSGTTYSPAATVTREQMAAFVTRTMDQSVKRSSMRTALDQFWRSQTETDLGTTTVGSLPRLVKSDGADLWVANSGSGSPNNGSVSRVRASDGKLLETWTGAAHAWGVLVARSKVFITGATTPTGTLYQIDPTQPPGAVTSLTTGLGDTPLGIAYDGHRVWTANFGTGPGTGSVSIVTLSPFSVTTVSAGFSQPQGILYDGNNIWVADHADNKLNELDANGAILQSVTLSTGPTFPAFDGTNIWVPSFESSAVTVVRAIGGLAGTVLATLSVNGVTFPMTAAFDGERILVTNRSGNPGVSVFKASDFSSMGTFGFAADAPYGACSDGLSFWIALLNTNKLVRL